MSSEASDGAYVTLVSSDGFEFVVLQEATLISPVIKGMLNPRSAFLEARIGRCVFEEIRYVPRSECCRENKHPPVLDPTLVMINLHGDSSLVMDSLHYQTWCMKLSTLDLT
jgi:hypothetical protein